MKDEDTLFRHMIRTPGPEFKEKWKEKSVFLSTAYFIEFLEFDKFCRDNNWTFSEGLIYLGQTDIEERKTKLEKEFEKISEYK